MLTLSETKSESGDSYSDQEGKYMAFTATIEEVERVIESKFESSSGEVLGEKATVQDTYDKLYRPAQISAKTSRLTMKKLNEVEL